MTFGGKFIFFLPEKTDHNNVDYVLTIALWTIIKGLAVAVIEIHTLVHLNVGMALKLVTYHELVRDTIYKFDLGLLYTASNFFSFVQLSYLKCWYSYTNSW